MTAVYTLSGAVNSLTYSSGHVVTNTFDQAGRLTGFSGNLGDGGTSRTYASSYVYNALSQMTQELFGTQTALYHKLQYNPRGQLWDVRLSTGADVNGSWNRGCLQFFYDSSYGFGTSGPDNDGNVLRSKVYIPLDDQSNNWAIHDQFYNYDSLNRIKSVAEDFVTNTQPVTHQFVQSYDYDRYGNRTIDIDPAKTWGTGINNKEFTKSDTTNRLGVPNGQTGTMSYDAAGNLTNDTYTGAGNRTYDAENKITSAAANNNQTATYTYDATGQRIKRTAEGVETWQVYGWGGELLAEYPASGPAAIPQKEYGYRNGQLLVTAAPWVNTIQNVAWTSATGVSVSGNTLTKTGAAGWNAGAVSTQSISSGDGFVEFTASETNLARMCGLGNGNSGQNYTDIEFGIQLTASDGTNGIWIFESGMLRGNFGTYSAGDKFRVGVESGVVKYYKISGGNQTLLYTSTVTPSYPLLVDTSLYSTAATLTGVVIANLQAVSFTNATGVAVSGNTLTKTGAAGWNAGAVSTQTINSGDGYVEFTASQTNLARMCGLGNGDSSQNYTDVEFAIQLTASDGTNGIWVIESGTLRGNFGTYSAGDKFRVAVESGVVKYRKNGTLLYTSSVTPTYPLLVDTSLYSTNSTVSNIVFSGASPQIQWLISDHLGTPRMIVDPAGTLASVKRHDYLPFGEELFTPTGGRTTPLGYAGGDSVRQQFTQKERDIETGLDYFLARSYSSTQGRFTSPDEFPGGPDELNNFAQNAANNPTFYADPTNPQSLNKYQYTYNDPLSLTDDDGHCPVCVVVVVVVAIEILSAPDTTSAPTGRPGEVIPRSGDGVKTLMTNAAVGAIGGPILQKVGGAVVNKFTNKTATVVSPEVATRELALKTANEAQSLPGRLRPGSAGGMRARTGEMVSATSVRGEAPPALHPTIQKLMDLAPEPRGRAHGRCCEPQMLSKLLNDGVDPKGATSTVVRVRAPGNPNHGIPIPPCETCKFIFQQINK